MKKLLFAVVACFGAMISSPAQDRGFGVGVVIGDPTGVSAKLWMSGTSSLQMGFSLSDRFRGNRALMSADMVWHSFDAIQSTEKFPVYYGLGGVLSSGGGSQAALGFRGVLGVVWLSRSAPVDIFFQAVPTVTIVPASSFSVEAGVGIRFFLG